VLVLPCADAARLAAFLDGEARALFEICLGVAPGKAQ
jgi:hypothetical protein